MKRDLIVISCLIGKQTRYIRLIPKVIDQVYLCDYSPTPESATEFSSESQAENAIKKIHNHLHREFKVDTVTVESKVSHHPGQLR